MSFFTSDNSAYNNSEKIKEVEEIYIEDFSQLEIKRL